MANETVLEQTRSAFAFKGIVEGMTRQNAYREGTTEKGKNAGKDYRSINFAVKTSPTNKLYVGLYGSEQDFVYPHKKAVKDKDGKVIEKGHTLRDFPFEDRFEELPEGYEIIGLNMYLEEGEDGKNVKKTLVEFDAVEYIYDNINDGDSVFIRGEIRYSSYLNKDGDKVNKRECSIQSISRCSDIDFEAEDFKEINSFEQEMVFYGSEVDKKEGIVIVHGRTIQYGGKFTDTQFVIRPDGDERLEQLANFFASKKLKVGDFFKVYGLCVNKVETVDEDVAEKPASIFGGGYKPEGVGRRSFEKRITEFQIVGAEDESYIPKRYKDSDFVVQEIVQQKEEEKFTFGAGKGSILDEIDEEDLPF